MRFKCPSCGKDTVSFASKAKLVLGGKFKCPNCQTSLNTGMAIYLFGFIGTALIMYPAFLRIVAFFGIFKIWFSAFVFVGLLVLAFVIITLIYPISKEYEHS